MKKTLFLFALCMAAGVLPAQKKMYVWVNEVPTEYSVLDVDSITFADALPEPTPEPEPEPEPKPLGFSVSEDKRVLFSSGNLQYTQSTQTWSFAAEQYEFIGNGNKGAQGKLEDRIDLFVWSAANATGQYKWGIHEGSINDHLGGFADWGQNIGDGMTWRTLNKDEWDYVFNSRPNASTLKGVARINLTEDGSEYANGLILLPDNWTALVTFKSGFAPKSDLASIEKYADYQTFTLSDWEKLEDAGAVFLPAAGFANESGVNGGVIMTVQTNGEYWSGTMFYTNKAYSLWFGAMSDNTGSSGSRTERKAVRLVQDIK